MDGTPYVVNDVMTRRVIALRTGAAFKDIVRTMRRRRVSALPVLDHDGRVVGVVSEADLLRKEEYRDAAFAPDKARAVTAGELMTAPPVTVHPGATVAQAARVMARSGVKRLPVVGPDGELEGIVSRSDLLKVFLRDDADIAEEVRREVVERLFADTPAQIEVDVRDGVVTLSGRVRDTDVVPVATRMTRSVEGVVDVDCALLGPPRVPDLDPDLPEEPAHTR
ncbi:CBS domain-containing protein [Streptomyces sp. V3I7]|uniref:CBS domain-containing protein n=1 Tax=Streptomyces sp. V3I7 TaxID=3042278 RepID=UPI00278944DC|nr:CBS domain-containing protein [Streptomyces sp. V3I7]MDQ0989166.1 CBS-domain-containing membrane protein [Streptomyces sp. V3I7]